ncbi:O-acetyl-ADP-ribose deacetylase [Hyphodiscus hymeniophilus]|uniref:O-acetyl-ADP-ribose deacetylase n=1 Tax=Hyphodiscus hymeniophilus TaxID=353542 RepID=A0A9P6VEE8_9HELO|nr:O-acetyl-ADP-ribose deacetylase [Hyphodiscus hymeniophilus]
MTIIPAAEIPTVSLLYRLKKLAPAEIEHESPAKPSQSFNDRIGLIRGDITKLEVDAIVNAANNSLLGGGGVDGAIHAAAGPGLLRECRKLNGCATGSAKITGAYDLPCKKVIHAVGPIYSRSYVRDSAKDLESCYTTSLQLAVENGCKSIAFSAVSTGVYGYPSNDAAPVAIGAVKKFLESKDGDKLKKVVFTTFVMKDVEAYNHWLPRFFPSTEPEAETENESEEGWEEVKGGESAENGPVEKEEVNPEAIEEDASNITLPDVPAGEPKDDGPAAKKQKANDEEKL